VRAVPPTPEVPVAAVVAVPQEIQPAETDRGREVIAALARHRIAVTCWNEAMRRDPQHPGESIGLRLAIDEAGHGLANIEGSSDPVLSACLQRRTAALNFGAGGEINLSTRFNFTTAQ
jgi:hypothetical protein